MSRIQYQLKKRLYRLKTYRRKGFGIHSPFVFHLVTNVIEAKLNYYAFQQLSPCRDKAIQLLGKIGKKESGNSPFAKRYWEEEQEVKSGEALDRLLFRLMNFSRSKTPAYFGGGLGLSIAYLAKVDSRINVSWIDREQDFKQVSDDFLQNQIGVRNIRNLTLKDLNKVEEPFDFAVFSDNCTPELYQNIAANCHKYFTNRCFVIVKDIYKNENVNQFWLKLKEMDRFSVSFDLFHLGILIAKSGMQKQSYVMKYRF